MEALTELEKLCEKLVETQLGADLWAGYQVARAKIFKDLLPHIARNEPFLTDHGPEHITNVLNNAFDLLGREQCVGRDSRKSLEPVEVYFLVLSILFHDVGNVFSREGHKSRLHEAYEFARGDDQSFLVEKQLLFKIVEAHGGEAPNGSPDTIGSLEPQGVFRGKRVDCQRVAAILRLADELAEGPQRTSLFMQRYLRYPKGSRVFHDYASVCNVHIGREDGRLTLVYHIEMMPAPWGPKMDFDRLRKLVGFCYHRLVKMDLERKYNRHYCSLLLRFKRTEVSFHFHCKGRDLEMSLPKIVLDDLVLPNADSVAKFTEANPEYNLDELMKRLREVVHPKRG